MTIFFLLFRNMVITSTVVMPLVSWWRMLKITKLLWVY